MHKRALDIQEKALGTSHSAVAGSLHLLGKLFLQQSKFEQAESYFKKSIKVRQDTQGPSHPTVASVFMSLADLYKMTNHKHEAEQMYKMALNIYKSTLTEKHFSNQECLNALNSMNNSA